MYENKQLASELKKSIGELSFEQLLSPMCEDQEDLESQIRVLEHFLDSGRYASFEQIRQWFSMVNVTSFIITNNEIFVIPSKIMEDLIDRVNRAKIPVNFSIATIKEDRPTFISEQYEFSKSNSTQRNR